MKFSGQVSFFSASVHLADGPTTTNAFGPINYPVTGNILVTEWSVRILDSVPADAVVHVHLQRNGVDVDTIDFLGPFAAPFTQSSVISVAYGPLDTFNVLVEQVGFVGETTSVRLSSTVKGHET